MADQPYDLFVFHRSYFCGKMLAYLRYKEIPHRPIYKDLATIGATLTEHTGLRQLPVIRTPEGQWMNDTTPMMEWFENRYSDHSVLPDDPVNAFLTRLLEDYADEWLWRPAILSRWESREDRSYYQSLFVHEFLGGFWSKNRFSRVIAGRLVLKHQRDKFLYGDGLTAENREHVWSIYTNILNRLETIFQQQPYLLGDKPCLADFGFFGSMFWHFGNDPAPNRIMQDRAPGVYEWVARLWNMTASKAENSSFQTVPCQAPSHWGALLEDVCKNYLPYLHANAQAYEKGLQRFNDSRDGFLYPNVHVSPYRVWCRERLQYHLNQLSSDEKHQVKTILEPMGGWSPLTQDAHIQSHYDPKMLAPFCEPQKVGWYHRAKSRFTGSNHIRSRRAWQ